MQQWHTVASLSTTYIIKAEQINEYKQNKVKINFKLYDGWVLPPILSGDVKIS